MDLENISQVDSSKTDVQKPGLTIEPQKNETSSKCYKHPGEVDEGSGERFKLKM